MDIRLDLFLVEALRALVVSLPSQIKRNEGSD